MRPAKNLPAESAADVLVKKYGATSAQNAR